jgi:hypothetical protein
MRGVHVAIPATIVSFDEKSQTAKVSIDIWEQIGEENKSIATLEDVPFAFARSGGFVITFPVNIGDKVQLLFQHRSIDKWLMDGEKDSQDLRTHNINDSIASNLIAYPLNDTIEKFSKDSLVIRSMDNSVYVKLKEDAIELKAKNITIIGDVKIKGKLEVTGIIKSLKNVLAKTISLLSHLHSGVLSGGAKTAPPE